MRSASLVVASVLAGVAAGFLAAGPSADAQRAERPPQQKAGADKTLAKVVGRAVACDNVRILYDRRLPSEGAAARGVLILNPRLLGELPGAVRLFVFHHECGHHHVGASELKADCWAVGRGVDDGWLDRKDLKAVCGSFGGVPATSTHPSAARRCRNLDRCFATAVAARDRRQSTAAAAARKAKQEPQLVGGPKAIPSGTAGYSGSATKQ
jgi:hypothetical protein